MFEDDPCETYNPDGTVNPNDADCDGMCLTDPEAGNAGDYTDTDNSLCEECPDGFPIDMDCAGACLNDTDGDGVCNDDEVPVVPTPRSVHNDATDDDGLPVPGGHLPRRL